MLRADFKKTFYNLWGLFMKFIYLGLLAFSLFGCASTTQNLSSETKMIGEVTDEPTTHDTRHLHTLKFVDQVTGESFKVVDSPNLVKLHHETGKSYLIEAQVEKKQKFIFWGENLIVKSFSILKETSEEVPHKYYDNTKMRSGNYQVRRIGRDRL
jgi:hypothetical protein